MISNKVHTKYYLFDLYKGQQIREFYCEDSLKDWLVFSTRETYLWLTPKIKNEYLDEIALSTNDLMETVDTKTLVGTCCHRRYMFYDEYGRIIDARVYWEEVKETFLKRKTTKYERRIPEDAKYGEVFNRYSWAKGNEYRFKFRCGPVPGTSYHWRGYCYRRPKTTAEIRMNCDPEYKDFVRPRRRLIPTAYDDVCISSYRSRSWKDNTKKRKQWM